MSFPYYLTTDLASHLMWREDCIDIYVHIYTSTWIIEITRLTVWQPLLAYYKLNISTDFWQTRIVTIKDKSTKKKRNSLIFIFLFSTNNSIQYYSFICTLLNHFNDDKWLIRSIWAINGILTGTTTPGQSENKEMVGKLSSTSRKAPGLGPRHQRI